MIRFYGNAMQGMMGKYLENNIKAFAEAHSTLQDQIRSVYGEGSHVNQDLWAQFFNFQGPALQSMMSAYVEQSKQMYQKMQEQVETQARNMLTGFRFGQGDQADDRKPRPARKKQ